MPCFYPLQAWRLGNGEIVFVERGDVLQSLLLPCGRCVGCRLERSRQWAVRIMHEASGSEDNSFVTLTYDDAHAPVHGSLNYGDFQRFMKRLRRAVGPVRFFMCGEYGADRGRPHFHAGLFGVSFRNDRYRWRKGQGGYPIYRSPLLELLWPFGSSEIGELCRESAAYMARYTFKKVTGDLADRHYERIDNDTGEVVHRHPEFARMSLRPGIGANWFAKFNSDVYPHDRVVCKGVEGKPPRYYDTLLKRLAPDVLESVQQARILDAVQFAPDCTVERLAVRELVTQARVSFFKRKLK